MMRVVLVLALALLAAPAWSLDPPVDSPDNPSTPAKVALGKALFWEEQLSVTRTVACGTCHRPFSGGADPRAGVAGATTRHPGPDGIPGNADDIGGSMGVPAHTRSGAYVASATFGFAPQVGKRAAPSVINSGYLPDLLWDGRVRALAIPFVSPLENQALLPLVDPLEMSAIGDTLADVPARIAGVAPLALAQRLPQALRTWIGGRRYPALFAEAFGSPEITAERIAMAIASYERSLVSAPDFQDPPPMTPLEEQGRNVFGARCSSCHLGPLATDSGMHYIGVRPVEDDLGHFAVSGDSRLAGAVRTPSLRNVALRSTFFHNGRFNRLEDVIEFYSRGGDFTAENKDRRIRPFEFSDEQKTALLAFLQTLSDPRVAAESPPFDRPTLYTETDRIPRLVGEGRAGGPGVPRLGAIEPPLLGSDFTVTVEQARANAAGTLVVSYVDPGIGADLPTGEFASMTFTTDAAGRASVDLPLAAGMALAGTTLRGRAYLADPAAEHGFAVTRAFEITLFTGEIHVFTDDFE
jgi:cytochrome c peroxidase